MHLTLGGAYIDFNLSEEPIFDLILRGAYSDFNLGRNLYLILTLGRSLY